MKEWVTIRAEDDVYVAMAVARRAMRHTTLSTMDQQMVLVSVAELTRNVLDHAGAHGTFSFERTPDGIQIEVKDTGPGITNLESALSDERVTKTTSHGLGLGLVGVKRLMDELNIQTSPKGSHIIAIKREYRGQPKSVQSYPFSSDRADVCRDRA